jgi:hypothetical protein
MMQAAFTSVADFDDGSDTPKNYNELLKNKIRECWWASIKQEIYAMETLGV